MINRANKILLLKFIAVGVLNTAFGFGCYYVFLQYGFHYAQALLLATILGVLFNFKSTGFLVFRSIDNSLIIKFIAGYVVVYIINLIGIKLLTELKLTPEFGGALLILPMAALSFLINKNFVFKK